MTVFDVTVRERYFCSAETPISTLYSISRRAVKVVLQVGPPCSTLAVVLSTRIAA